MTAYKQSATAAEIKAAFDIGVMTEETRQKIIDLAGQKLTREETAEFTNAILSQIPKEYKNGDKLLLAVRQAYIIGFYTAANLAQEANNLTYCQLFGADEQGEKE